jgi:hypothetical protein
MSKDAVVVSNVLCPTCGAFPGDRCTPGAASTHGARFVEQHHAVEALRRDGYEPVLRRACDECGAPAWYPCIGALVDPTRWHGSRELAEPRERFDDAERFDDDTMA